MPVSTEPISSVLHSTVPAPTGQRPTALVRKIRGVYAPMAGPWDIGGGQRLGLQASGLRTRVLPARVQSGTLIVTDDLLGSSLDFTMLVPDTTCCIGFTAHVTQMLSVDVWQADGETTTASGSRPVFLQLRHNGVFHQRGRPPCLWVTIRATVDVPELGVAVGSRRASRLKFDAELNLHPR